MHPFNVFRRFQLHNNIDTHTLSLTLFIHFTIYTKLICYSPSENWCSFARRRFVYKREARELKMKMEKNEKRKTNLHCCSLRLCHRFSFSIYNFVWKILSTQITLINNECEPIQLKSLGGLLSTISYTFKSQLMLRTDENGKKKKKKIVSREQSV